MSLVFWTSKPVCFSFNDRVPCSIHDWTSTVQKRWNAHAGMGLRVHLSFSTSFGIKRLHASSARKRVGWGSRIVQVEVSLTFSRQRSLLWWLSNIPTHSHTAASLSQRFSVFRNQLQCQIKPLLGSFLDPHFCLMLQLFMISCFGAIYLT